MVTALTTEHKNLIQTYIKSKKIKAVESIDVKKGRVRYTDAIISTRDIEELKDEELVRAYLLTKLSNEIGYPIEKIELEHTYTAGRPHTNTSRIDVVVRDKDGNAFLFIEVKKPDEYASIDKDETIREQLFKVAGMEKSEGSLVQYLVLYTLDIQNNKIFDDCIVIAMSLS